MAFIEIGFNTKRPLILGRGGFGEDQRADELRRHALMADREVVDRTLGLRAV